MTAGHRNDSLTSANKRTNEVGAFKTRIEPISELKGTVITADAMLTQKSVVRQIFARDGDDMLMAKDNQKTLAADLRLYFEEQKGQPPACLPDDGRAEYGRFEARAIGTTTELNGYLQFPGIKPCFMIERQRWVAKKGKKVGEPSIDYGYGITSLSPDQADAETLLRLNRNHWSIAALHNKLDDAEKWHEDNCRIRAGNGPQNMSILRRFAIFILGKRLANSDLSRQQTPSAAAKTASRAG
ncbi:MAG: ISAs1 family transposase [Aestuariivita sp.]|nr:ISAs1 family transposase [Aestuariivita sp.]MCY4347397.1 ISAs1 family transposase [Aestuariivita sp.]